MSTRGYQKYEMIIASGSKFAFGGTDYTLLALNPNTVIPSGVATSSYTSQQFTPIQDTTIGETKTFTFIIPNQLDAVSIIDGATEGTLKISAQTLTHAVTEYIDITNIDIGLRAVDSTGSIRQLSDDLEIWSGSIKALGNAATTTAQLLQFSSITDAIVYSNERVLVDFTVTFDTYDLVTRSPFQIDIWATLDADETTITLPFVM